MKHTILTLTVCLLFAYGALTYADVYTQNGDKVMQAQPTPNILPLECSIERETPMDTFIESIFLENGLEIFTFDTNKDGQHDAELAIPQGDENRYPLHYMFDRDYDGEPDFLYTDQKRDGTCDMIQVESLQHKRNKKGGPRGPIKKGGEV